jgi:hypothetical protein
LVRKIEKEVPNANPNPRLFFTNLYLANKGISIVESL